MEVTGKRQLVFIASAVICLGVAIGPAVFSAEDASVSAIVEDTVFAAVQWVLPQGRVGAPETNDDTTFYVTVRTATNSDDVILYTQPALVSTGVDGTYTTAFPLVGIPAGTYDVGLKGHQHLTRVLDDVALVNGTNVLNFTQPDNSVPKGTQVLLAGDVNLAGITPATLGDDVVNSVDITTILDKIDDSDLTGNAERTNLNQDVVVNSVDISLLLSNLDVEGDN